MSADPFRWEDNDEDEVRATCSCGWSGPWRDQIDQVRLDELLHHCERSVAWRVAS